jgi:hypothetical protein
VVVRMGSTVTLVWDSHGGGRLVGIFDDRKAIEKLRRLVTESGEVSYVRFSDVKLNELVSTGFSRRHKSAR